MHANGFTVTVDGSYTALTVSNAAVTSPAIAHGGSFALANGVTLTATAGFFASATSALTYGAITCALGAGQAATLVGTVQASALLNNASHCTVQMTGLGSLTIVGDCIAGGSASVRSSNGTLNIIGNLTGTTVFNGGPHVIVTSGSVSLTGNINGAGSHANSQPMLTTSSGMVASVTGSIFGMATLGAGGASIAGRLVHLGSASATQNSCAVVVAAGGSAICSGPLVNWPGPTNIGRPAVLGPGALMVHEDYISTFYLEMHQSNALGTVRPIRRFYAAEAAAVFSAPAESDVRSGTIYGPGGEFEGTLAVPPVSAVGLGVPVDAAVGTAVWTQESLAAALAPLFAAYGS